MSFSVFIAGCVFVQYLKSRPDDTAVQSSLEFLVSALSALTVKNSLSKAFLDQLVMDVNGMDFNKTRNSLKTGLSSSTSRYATVSSEAYGAF